MKGQRPSPRNRDAESRRAAHASVARRKRMITILANRDAPPGGAPSSTVADAPSPTVAAFHPGPSEPQDQPVPWGWQSTGSDLPPAGRRYDPALYASGNQVIVPPQEPPAQPQPVLQSGASATAEVGSFAASGNAQSPMEPATFSVTATGPIISLSRIETDYINLLPFAISLEKMARDEMARLSSERPNDPYTIENNNKQCDLLSILADGFAKLAAALMDYAERPQPLLAGKAKKIADDLGAQFGAWWKKNAGEAIDWAVRIPTLMASIAALGWAGADMSIATAAVSGLVGGPKVISAIKAANKRRKRP
jgi:hypothetical protein